MNRTATLPWFARHELSLSWRDLYAMLSANRQGRGFRIALVLGIVIAGMHFLAWLAMKGAVAQGIKPDREMLITVTGMLVLPVSLMASQAMETITRAFYTRSDLELILSSPAPSRKVFIVRMAAIAVSTTSLSLLVCAPALNVLAFLDHPGWLLGYAVVTGFGMLATATAILLTLALFRIAGPKRTRTIAQIAAAIVGAGFVVGIQLLAISAIGSASRIELFRSAQLSAVLPPDTSFFFAPAAGAMGDITAAAVFFVFCASLLLATILLLAGQFGDAVIKAGSVDSGQGTNARSRVDFAKLSPAAVLRRKEWKVLLRDKWLISQTLMQLFYLVPPAFMLWQGFGGDSAPYYIIVPVMVMAAGQLSGGLAWLAISGEDAPELVATAPVTRKAVIRAKVEAVLIGCGMVCAPLVAGIAVLSLKAALIGIVVLVAAIGSATAIQLWFRSQAKRSSFRRRHTSSRIATVAEAFSSILWAGVAGIWIGAGFLAAAILAIVILLMLTVVYRISPAQTQ